ncbi:MAG: BPL-N domain-containing protein [Bdellovibrionota bacterium]
MIGFAESQPLALVYKGPGSCVEIPQNIGCSESAAEMAKRAGFRVEYVGPKETSFEVFKDAKVWIQPGGRARLQVLNMAPELKKNIAQFVSEGGGYVGFCAGAFLAADQFGWEDPEKPENNFESKGLGIVPGYGHYINFFGKKVAEIIPVIWGDSKRDVYWEEGPYFLEQKNYAPGTEIVAYYPFEFKETKARPIMSLNTSYKKGRVAITSVHPEAPQEWREYYKITDNDGLDYNLAVDMIKWSAAK